MTPFGPQRTFALLLIDLDCFKEVNDALGHDAGDAPLVEIARRPSDVAGRVGLVARLGGDEFAIVLHKSADADTTEQTEQLRLMVSAECLTSIPMDGRTITVSASIGVARFPAHAANEQALYKAADIALYEAKQGDRGTWRYHDRGGFTQKRIQSSTSTMVAERTLAFSRQNLI